jgi:hypothetical protein
MSKMDEMGEIEMKINYIIGSTSILDLNSKKDILQHVMIYCNNEKYIIQPDGTKLYIILESQENKKECSIRLDYITDINIINIIYNIVKSRSDKLNTSNI